MKVALVCGTFAPERDGVADYVGRLADELEAIGVRCVIAARASDGNAGAEPRSAGGHRAVAVVPNWSWWHSRRAAAGLDALGCDVVHVQFAPSAYGYSPAVGWLPSRLRTPLVTTVHEYGWWSWPSRLPERAWRLLERHGRYDRETGLLAGRSRAVLATNAAHAEAVLRRLRRTAEIVPIGPNIPGPFTDHATAAARVRSRMSLDPEALLLVFFGFVHPVKGVRELIDAVAQLTAEGQRLAVVVAGGFTSLALPGAEAEDFRAEVERRIADRGVADRVTLTGWLPPERVSELLSAADGVVLPLTAGVTTKSGSLLAAFAHEVPVLATLADEPDPLLADGRNLLRIARRRSPEAIAAAARRLVAHPELGRRVAAGGAELAAGRSWPTIAAEHARIYTAVLAR